MSLQSATAAPRRDLEAMRRRTVRVRHVRPAEPKPSERVQVSLWLPLTPLFVILAPFAILLAPLILFAPSPWRLNPYEAAFAVGRMLLALGGTDIDVDTPEARVRIKIL